MHRNSISASNTLPSEIPNHNSSDKPRPKGHMPTEAKLLDLLSRAFTTIGEGLIANELDESAAELHNEIGAVLGLPVVKIETVRCEAKWFVDGGRTERQCREVADNVSELCGNARCETHDDLYFEERDGKIFCEECLPSNE